MKAMILAAGRGKRMMPLTKNIPKPLLKVGSKSIIEYSIKHLKNNGFTDIVINTAYRGGQIEAQLGNGAGSGVSISYSRELKLGLNTAGGIINALPLLGDKTFLVINGDILSDYPLAELKKMTIKNAHCHIVLVPNPAHNKKGDFDVKNNYLIQHKNDNPYTFSGIGIYHPHFFNNYKKTNIALYQLLKDGIKSKTITTEVYYGKWCDIGTPRRLEQLQNDSAFNF